MTSRTVWTVAFYVGLAACPALLLLAYNNYGLTQYYSTVLGILATLGVGGVGVAAGAVAVVAHHKIAGTASAALPTATPSTTGEADRDAQFEHLGVLVWQNRGPHATTDEIASIQKLWGTK